MCSMNDDPTTYDAPEPTRPRTYVLSGQRPPDEPYMPPIAAYMALAQAMHDVSDLCNANYDLPFADCGVREADITDAIAVLRDLHADDWVLIRQPVAVAGMGL